MFLNGQTDDAKTIYLSRYILLTSSGRGGGGRGGGKREERDINKRLKCRVALPRTQVKVTKMPRAFANRSNTRNSHKSIEFASGILLAH